MSYAEIFRDLRGALESVHYTGIQLNQEVANDYKEVHFKCECKELYDTTLEECETYECYSKCVQCCNVMDIEKVLNYEVTEEGKSTVNIQLDREARTTPLTPDEEERLYPGTVIKDFMDDNDKMQDFIYLSKEEFLKSYSYLSEAEWDATYKRVKECNPHLIWEDIDKIIRGLAVSQGLYGRLLANLEDDALSVESRMGVRKAWVAQKFKDSVDFVMYYEEEWYGEYIK